MSSKNPAAVALGRLGGSATSAAKRAAARRNGQRGGRPPKPASTHKRKASPENLQNQA